MPSRFVLASRWSPALALFLLLLSALWVAGGASHADVTGQVVTRGAAWRSEEHTSELQSLMRISYAVFCLKKQTLAVNKSSCLRSLHKAYVSSKHTKLQMCI